MRKTVAPRGGDESGKLTKTEIRSKSLTLNGKELYGKVPNSQSAFSFSDDIEVARKATFAVYADKGCTNALSSNYVLLNTGDNYYYVSVTNGDDTDVYTVNVYRRSIYTVTFNTDGGTSVAPQHVEEGGFAAEPTAAPVKTGYSFLSWNYDFTAPVLNNTVIVANFSADVILSEDGTIVIGLNNKVSDLVILPEYNGVKVASIGASAFKNRSSLRKVTISLGVTEIGEHAFDGCRSLTDIEMPAGITRIGKYAFNGCKSLASINVPSNVTTIGASAFKDCESLTSVTLPYNITSIENMLFYNCKSLASIKIPDCVERIGDSAFSSCQSLTSVTIPRNVKTIDTSAFFNCAKLVEVINESEIPIKKGSTNYGYVAAYALNVKEGGSSEIYDNGGYLFYSADGENYLIDYIGNETELTLPASYNGQNYKINRRAFSYRNDITSVVIPNGVTSVGNSAFYYCKSLESVVIPNSVTSVGNSAFYYCKSLTNVEIPDSVTSIGKDAFSNCGGLTSVTIGRNVENIGSYAFGQCHGLAEVINKSELNFTIGSNDNGYVAYYALSVKTGGTSEIINNGGFFFYRSNGVNYLVNYVGSDGDLSLPENCNGQSYVINKYAFFNREDITSVVLSDGVTAVGDWAFCRCDSLMSVTLGKNVSAIGNAAFFECARLIEVINKSSINVVKGNSTENGYVAADALNVKTSGESEVVKKGDFSFYNADGVNYLVYYTGKETDVELPEDYDGNSYEIYRGMFYHNDDITSVVISDGVTAVGEWAFDSCSSLTSVTIGAGVNRIDKGAFSDFTLLTVIEYNGTKEQWERITKDENWNNSSRGVTIKCTDGDITL